MKLVFPEKIGRILERKPYQVDDMGLSGSTVILFDELVLKIEPHSEKTDGTVEMMRWLKGKIPVPDVIEYEVQDGKSWLLMTRMDGDMCCDEQHMEQSEETVGLMAAGLKLLWSIDVADCPREFSLEEDEKAALERIRNGRMSHEELLEYGFETAEEMIAWIENHKPTYEPVLSHGDYCMPNVLLKDGRVSAFIDIGDIGIADRYKDVVTGWGSLRNNYSGYFGGKVYVDFDPDLLLQKLGGGFDPDKFRYCRLIEKALS